MGPIRSLITRLVLLVSVLITAASVWVASQQDLQFHVERGQRELFDELVRVDVAQVSADERAHLVRRVDRAFRLGADWQEPMLQLDEPSWTRFRENMLALLKDWLIDRSKTYYDQGRGHHHWKRHAQEQFVDRQVNTLMAWMAAAPQPSADQSRRLQARLSPFEAYARVQQWINEADVDTRVRLETFTRALVERAAQRKVDRISGPGN